MNQNLFLQIVQAVANIPSTLPIVQYQETCFQLQPFQVHKLSADRALQTYKRIEKKYEAENDITMHAEVWNQSQKRLYAWFLTFYTYLNRDHNGIKVDINFTLLSQAFFNKKPEFLEFHFLALLKSNQKIFWDNESDKKLLQAFKLYGTKWNQVSRYLYSLNKHDVFRSPKHCRQRWMNHLDETKVRGNWTDQEDLTIFQYVMQNQGKKWSKLVNVLNDKRTEHSIKNRFNAMITKHRKYKLEKMSKVAARVLQLLRTKIENQSNIISGEDLPLQQNHSKSPQCLSSKVEIHSNMQTVRIDDQEKCLKQPSIDNIQEIQLKKQRSALQQPIHKYTTENKPVQPIDNAISQCLNQPSSCLGNQNEKHYPFETYSYEMEMCNYASHIYEFQKNQYLFYQQMMTLTPMPTTDTNRTTRQSKIMQERKRNKQSQPKSEPDSKPFF